MPVAKIPSLVLNGKKSIVATRTLMCMDLRPRWRFLCDTNLSAKEEVVTDTF